MQDDDDDDDGKDVFHWYVDCIHSETKEMSRKEYVLNESLMSETERHEFNVLMTQKHRDWQLLKFRRFFIEVSEAQLSELQCNMRSYSTVNQYLPPDGYFEDENGKPMNELGMLDVATGDPTEVYGGNVQSAYRRGVTTMKDKEGWTVDKANNVAHFLQLVQQIRTSNWIQHDLSFTTQGGKVLEAKYADQESTRSFLFSLRQLLMPGKSDDSFNLACDIYSAHVSDQAKVAWVKHEQEKFANVRKHICAPWQIDAYTMEEVIEMVIYGAGLAHRVSRDKWEEKLPAVLEKHGKERFQFVFQGSCRTLLNYPMAAAPIIGQDFANWIKNEGCVGPTRVWDSDLF